VELTPADGTHLSSGGAPDPLAALESLQLQGVDVAALKALIEDGRSLSDGKLKGLVRSVLAGMKDSASTTQARFHDDAQLDPDVATHPAMLEGVRVSGLGAAAELLRHPGPLRAFGSAGPLFPAGYGLLGLAAAGLDIKRLVDAIRAARATVKATGDKAYAAGRVAPAALRVINDVAMVIHPAFILSSVGLSVLNHFLGRRRDPASTEPTDPAPAAG
jgi:hypothetical protein